MPDTLPERVLLGDYVLDVRAGELREGNRIVRLQEQPFQILLMLVERDGEIVTRDEIQKKLWPDDTVVEYGHSINAAIKKLRQAFGDSADDPRYVGTVARRGYRLLMPVGKTPGGLPNKHEKEEPGPGWVGGQAGKQVSHFRIFKLLGGGADPEPPPEAAPVQEGPGTNLIGKKVSHYRVLEVIGCGGMGLVYKAEDLRLGRQVALKFLPEDLAWDPVALQRFEREARTASSLDHPNICTIYEVEDHEEQPFIVMQLLQGGTLRDRLTVIFDSQPATALAELLFIAISITQGLEAAHEQGVIHRDIKPSNIFLTNGGQVKILDFGLAKLVDSVKDYGSDGIHSGDNGTSLSGDVNLTRQGTTLGTAGYMSPEQIRGEKLDARTDIFSFGLVLYEMATGRRPFKGEDAEEVQIAILNIEPLPARERNRGLPPKLDEIITKCLQKDREQRYQSAGQVCTELEGVRAALDPRWSNRSLWFAVAAVLALTVGIGAFFYSRRQEANKSPVTTVLADFSGDPRFNLTLNTALGIKLEQSPFVTVLSTTRVKETLKLMDRKPGEALTPELARDVCLRSNAQAVLAGSVSSMGEHFLIAVKAIGCKTGNTLASAEAEASSKEKLLKAVNEVGNQLREKLGESPASREKFNTPLEEATTPSLEALEAFTRGRQVRSQGADVAIPYFERAIQLDPNFARAYSNLGSLYYNAHQENLAAYNIKKAYELRDRVSERERFSVEGAYYGLVTGELPKAIQIYDQWVQAYPNDFTPHANLGLYYARLGMWQPAIAAMQEETRVATTPGFTNANLISVYLVLGRLDEVQKMLDHARPDERNDPTLRECAYLLAFLRGDKAGMQEHLNWAMGTSIEDRMQSVQADTEAYYGRVAVSRSLTQAAVDSARRVGATESAAGWKTIAALREAEIGNLAHARKNATEALLLSNGRSVRILAALTFARIGDAVAARKQADALNEEFPLDTSLQGYWLPCIRAAIELGKHDPKEAIALLEPASTYETAWQPPFELGPMYPAYLRGLAFLQADQPQAAASEFQKMLFHPGVTGNFVLAALAPLQLGRAQAAMNNHADARKCYEDFLALWKEADPDVPVLKQAKLEHTKLQ